MITILYPYRDRELSRIKRSLDSLSEQSNKNFNVLFVDYGSEPELSKSVKELLSSYDFVKHIYSYHCNQPWSRAKAINIGLKQVETEYVFVSDIDMIFKRNFIEIVQHLKDPMVSVYFKVGFLSQLESRKNLPFEDYKISFSSKPGAQGLSLFPVEALKKVRGFDEFLHFWGAEDEDVHSRLLQIGYEVIFYEKEILLLHRWHPTYRNLESQVVTKDLQIHSIPKLNQEYFAYTRDRKVPTANGENWGLPVTKEDYEALISKDLERVILNNKEYIYLFLFVELPRLENGVIAVEFREDPFQHSLKYFLKKKLGKSVSSYFTLKEINDILLLHLIFLSANYQYSFTVGADLKSIQLRIKK
jgi:glycosyltransferase involved in cell wall biosynthesis